MTLVEPVLAAVPRLIKYLVKIMDRIESIQKIPLLLSLYRVWHGRLSGFCLKIGHSW